MAVTLKKFAIKEMEACFAQDDVLKIPFIANRASMSFLSSFFIFEYINILFNSKSASSASGTTWK